MAYPTDQPLHEGDTPEEELYGCGYEYDHKVPPGENECTECGAELESEDE